MWYKVSARLAAPGRVIPQGYPTGHQIGFWLFGVMPLAVSVVSVLLLAVVVGMDTVQAQDGATPEPAPEPTTTPPLTLTVLPAEVPVLEGRTVAVVLTLDRFSDAGVTVGYIVYSRDYDTAQGGADYEAHDLLKEITFHKTAHVEIPTMADLEAEPMESFHFEVVTVSPNVLFGDLPTRQSRIWIEDLPVQPTRPAPLPETETVTEPETDPGIDPVAEPETEGESHPGPEEPEPTATPWPTAVPFPLVPTPAPPPPEPEPESRLNELLPWAAGAIVVGGAAYWIYKKRQAKKVADDDDDED